MSNEPQDLAYRIVRLQEPNGRSNTTYCYDTPEKNDAARERDWQHDAAQIRPLIEEYHAAATARIAGLLTTLGRVQKATIARNATLDEWETAQQFHAPGETHYDGAKARHDAAWTEYCEAWNEATQALSATPLGQQGEPAPSDALGMADDELLELYQQISGRISMYRTECQIERMFDLRGVLRDRFATLREQLAEAKRDYESTSSALMATRQLATENMEEIRKVLGVPPGQDDKSSLRVIDYVRALTAEVGRLKQDGARLLAFSGAVLGLQREHQADVGGDFIQEQATKYGLLESKEMTAPCGPSCECAGITQFPTDCYFPTELGRAALSAPPDDTAPAKEGGG